MVMREAHLSILSACLVLAAWTHGAMAEEVKTNLRPFLLGNYWGYRDMTTGEFVIQPQFDNALYFSEGLALVLVDGKWGYINTTGEFVIKPNPQFDNAWSFSEGLAQVRVDDKLGYIDTTGKFVIRPRFYFAEDFSEGLAAVYVGGRWVELGEGYRTAVGGKWGYVDRGGELVISNPQFSGVESFHQGSARVRIGDEWRSIDKTGKYVEKEE